MIAPGTKSTHGVDDPDDGAVPALGTESTFCTESFSMCTDVLHEPFAGLGIVEQPIADDAFSLGGTPDGDGSERAALLWLGLALDLIRVEPAYRH